MLELRVARIISLLFHPLIVPTLGFLLLFNSQAYFAVMLNSTIKMAIYAIVVFNTLIIPALLALYLKRTGTIASLEMETPEERKLPYLFTACLYVVTYYLLRKVNLPPLLYLFLLGATLALIVTILINLKWKISAHMVGWGGLTGAVIGLAFRLDLDFRIVISLIVFISGLVGFARLRLKAHTPAQVYSGYLLGVACQLVLIM